MYSDQPIAQNNEQMPKLVLFHNQRLIGFWCCAVNENEMNFNRRRVFY